MKNIKKVVLLTLLLILCLTTFLSTNNCLAKYDWSKQIENQESEKSSAELMSPVKKISGTVLVVAKVACMGIALVMLVVLAMKYMITAPGDRATIKKHAVVYVVGAIILFASSGILQIIQKFAEKNIAK